MKRFILLFVAVITVMLCSCEGKVEFFKNEPPEIPSVFRANTIIKNKDGQFTVMTDVAADGTVEFLITEHETLKGIVFRSTPVSFEMVADGMTVSADNGQLPDTAIFSSLGNALREIHKTITEPVLKGELYEYTYSCFVLYQNALSGEIVSISLENIGYTVQFVY